MSESVTYVVAAVVVVLLLFTFMVEEVVHGAIRNRLSVFLVTPNAVRHLLANTFQSTKTFARNTV